MAMDRNTFRISYDALDEQGNGQRITLEQIGLDYASLVELQGRVVMPTIANLLAVFDDWRKAAEAKGKG